MMRIVINSGSTFINKPLILFHFRTLQRYKNLIFQVILCDCLDRKKKGGERLEVHPYCCLKFAKIH
jgi:hypothetical protein